MVSVSNMEHIYKYYIQHGMSCYLQASKDPADPTECLWIVNLKKIYTPGTGCPYAAVCSGPTDNSTCKFTSNFTGVHSHSDFSFRSTLNSRPDENLRARMTSDELEKLMCRLNQSSGMLKGQIILY